jgi:endoglucanase
MFETRERLPIVCPGRAARVPMTCLAGVLGVALVLAGCADAPKDQSNVLQVHAGQVVDHDGKPVWLRGVQFSNWAFDNPAPDQSTIDTYADQDDYRRAAAMGVNTIPFFFRSDQFEDDANPGVYKSAGFDWLDRNVTWARASGIRLVLTLLAPPGSPQWLTACDGNTVWDVPAYQDRTVALWQALAKRYVGEPAIAGYDLFAFPLPSVSTDQWHALANRLVSAVRTVDREHILAIEPPLGAACVYKGAIDASDMFRVSDPNVIYTLNGNVPWNYVAQLLASQGLGDGGSYPDETQLGALDGSLLQWAHNSYDSTPQEEQLALQPSETTWTKKSFVYRVTNPDYRIGTPVLQSDDNLGKVYFDDFVIKEYDENYNFVRTVRDVDIEDLTPWGLWQGFSDGSACSDCPAVAHLESDAHHGHASVSISGSTSSATLENDVFFFPVRLNYTYAMTGFVKGENSRPNSSSRFRLDFYKYDGVLSLKDKPSLASYLQGFAAWGAAQHVPLYVNDFGAGRPTFMDDKGGLRWVEDMLDLLKANRFHFAYDEYHSDDFGIYAGAPPGLPDLEAVNQPLVDLLSRELTQ